MNLKTKNVYQILFVIISATLIIYAIFNTRFLLTGPELIVTNLDTKTKTITSQYRDFTLEGTALHASFISVNEYPISVDEQGEFEQKLLLAEKINPVHIIARDRLGKEKKMIINVVYTGDEREPTFEEILSSLAKYNTHAASSTATSSTTSTTSEEI